MTAPVMPGDRRTIPFDYAFRFELTGEVNRVHSATVRVSVEGNFIAVAIGYGMIIRREPVRFGPGRVEDLDLDEGPIRQLIAALPAQPQPRPPREVLNLAVAGLPAGIQQLRARGAGPGLPAGAFGAAGGGAAPAILAAAGPAPRINWPPTLNDFRLSWVTNSLRRELRSQSPTSLSEPAGPRQPAADMVEVLTRGIRLTREAAESLMARGADAALSVNDLETMFEEIPPDDAQLQFLYRLMDEGTGREFQSDPILNTAGLGVHDGDRPFRQFAVPLVFEPLTTIRMDVIEKSIVPCEVHVALQGYRTLGERGTPTDARRFR